jgi:hypothetical protein
VDQTSFRARLGSTDSFAANRLSLDELPTLPSGGAPAPFNALDSLRMSGPSGSHPLAGIDLAQLVAGPTSGLEGGIELAGPVRVGETISGRIRVRAIRRILARTAVLRLTGVRLYEQSHSGRKRSPEEIAINQGLASISEGLGNLNIALPTTPTGSTAGANTAQETETWVEIHAQALDSLPFTEPALPATLEAGQIIDVPFTIPAPRLGPPTAHAGVAAIAWAVEAHWDMGFGADERVAAPVDVRQHPDLLRAGVLTLPSGALNDAVTDEGASIAVAPLPPIAPGTDLAVTIAWPDAPGGRSARVELNLDVSGDSSTGQVVASVEADNDALGGTTVTLPVAPDLPPTLEVPGLKVGYRIRVIVDRKMRSDESRERPIVLT